MIIAYAHIPETFSPQWLTQLQEAIPGKFLQTINLNKRRDGLARSLAGRHLLAQILKSEKQPVDRMSMLLDSYKRPYLEGSPWRFSISHSNNAVVCVCSNKHEVGIDIEKIIPTGIEDFTSLFSVDQLKEIGNPAIHPEPFYQLWTAKEAISKAIGRGLHIDFKSISFSKKGASVFEDHQWFTTRLDISAGYCCTLATDNQSKEFALEEVKLTW